ncbi:Short-chain dehydrogenase reductase sdr [Pleurostoma richardsiae]|uniref:Short-chain dehydrogenase reductase sdr n=1 Tax=Pleurostoma richardsiae TaxID=41990 RepID=A0AA38VQ24_9PEZI|nr:Short-chain dehydrogenase reductase sdr [Pleurostoma richardsiae]
MAATTARSVIVTGAAAGLGRAIATEFLNQGSQVSLVDISSDRLQATARELSSLGRCIAIEADVASESSASAIFGRSISEFGQVDALVNCAGIMDRFQGAGEHDVPLWHKVLGINLTGPFLLTRLAVQEFLREGRKDNLKGGSIVNIASIAGLRGGGSGSAYTASKWGLVGLTKNTAAIYAKQGIRCNAVCPGGMVTSITEGLDVSRMGLAWDMTAKLSEFSPGPSDINRLGRLISFLCSEDGQDISGVAIPIDGGWSAV